MDASDAVDLVRVATCSRELHDLFSDGVVKASMEHCREASERADIEAAHFNLVGDALHDVMRERGEVAQERDEALQQIVTLRGTVRHIEDALVQATRRVRDLELELAEFKRARTG